VSFIVLDVCICTHNPRLDILAKALASILKQTADGDLFRVLLVDNASEPPLDEAILTNFAQNGVAARMVREPRLGIARARLCAMLETDGEMLLFVDDDNELAPNYIAEGMSFASSHPDVGCFGGKLLLPTKLRPAAWIQPFLPYLAIKDIGDEPVIGKSPTWESWEPPTAGAFIKRSVLALYMQRATRDANVFKLGRSGSRNLSSCEDALIMSGSFSLGLANAYDPALVLHHHIDLKRFTFKYLLRLMYAYGTSKAILEDLLRTPKHNSPSGDNALTMLRKLIAAARQSLPFGIGMAAYYLGANSERRRQNKSK